MALIRPDAVVTSTAGVSRSTYSGVAIQKIKPVRWAKKVIILRNQSPRVVDPSLAQLDVRIKFGEIAHAHKGACSGFPGGLPGAASYIQAELTGYRVDPARKLKSYARPTLHNLDQLKAMRAEKEKLLAKGVIR
jgi:hypothetical protein